MWSILIIIEVTLRHLYTFILAFCSKRHLFSFQQVLEVRDI